MLVRYVRGPPHRKAIEALRSLGLIPCAVRASETPTKEPFDNFNRVLLHYWIYYCHYEGYTTTLDETRRLLVYLYYGKYTTNWGKQQPVIGFIHQACQNGMYRFSNVEQSFAQWFRMLRKDGRLLQFSMDGGSGKPPKEYLQAVESGLRACALGGSKIFTSSSMKSKKNWHAVDDWRKFTAYTHAVRHILQRKSYK